MERGRGYRGARYGIAVLAGALLVTGCASGVAETAGQGGSVVTPETTGPVEVDAGQADGALLSATTAGDAGAVRAALNQRARVDTRDSAGRTPLMIAVLDDNVGVARVLLEFGADPNATDNRGESPWVNTGVTGSVAMMEALLPARPDLTLRNRFGGNALIPAAEKGHLDFVREVLRQTDIEIDHINDLGWTALLEAVYYGDGSTVYRDIARVLVDHGADVTIRDANGRTAYDHAVRRGFADIAELVKLP
ncbi:ankyrin repeat domain-containing protein [Nocardia sp. NPDC050712]|uniref:ankyrin repeat domain-containing protein n=1 Tax=Nocardia sp. NPDC050712 TaxID=3155518 RepID=UPI0033C44B67